jgi:hypothetical protein
VKPGAKPFIYFYPTYPDADVCATRTDLPVVTAFPDTKVLAHGHSHPSEPNQQVICKDSTGNIIRDTQGNPQSSTTVDGADQGDWVWTNSVNDTTQNPSYQAKGWLPMPGFIFDKHNLFTMRPGQSLGDEHDPGNKFTFDKGRCKWPKRKV